MDNTGIDEYTRILVIGDSNCRNLEPSFQRLGLFDTKIVSLGSSTPRLAVLVGRHIPEIFDMDPDICIVHSGHNDLAYHARFNPEPMTASKTAEEVSALVMALTDELECPRVVVSPLLPAAYMTIQEPHRASSIDADF